jgi:hypothetical protein
MGLAAADLDGDHRAELVAATRNHGLQVWRRVHAHFRQVAPRPAAPAGFSHPARDCIGNDPLEADGNDASPDQRAAAAPGHWPGAAARAPAAHRLAHAFTDNAHVPSSLPPTPSAPRPPPALA